MNQARPNTREKGDRLQLGLSLLLALLIGAAFLYLATRAIPLEAVRDYLGQADWGQIALAALVFLPVYAVCHGARILRWYFLVRPLGEVRPKLVHQVCAVGSMAILLVPLRLGELVRPFLLARTSKISAAGVLATVVVERVVDGLIITGLLFLGLWTYQGGASIEMARGAGAIAALIFVPALVMAIVAYRNRELSRRITMATIGRFLPSIAEKVASLLEQFSLGFEAMARRGDLVPFLVGTAVYWATNVISMWVLLRLGFGIDIGLWEMMTVMAVLVVGIMVPTGPAMAGNFEYFVAHGMGLFVPLDQGSIAGQVGVFAALLHLLQVLVIVTPGVWIMVRNRQLRVNRKTLAESQSMADRAVSDVDGGLSGPDDDQ